MLSIADINYLLALQPMEEVAGRLTALLRRRENSELPDAGFMALVGTYLGRDLRAELLRNSYTTNMYRRNVGSCTGRLWRTDDGVRIADGDSNGAYWYALAPTTFGTMTLVLNGGRLVTWRSIREGTPTPPEPWSTIQRQTIPVP